MAAACPRIPYGEADIRRIRLRGWLYVDKTRFLRRLEEESYAPRPRPRGSSDGLNPPDSRPGRIRNR